MKGLVLEGPGEVAVRDVPEPEPAEGEVLLEVVACGVCGSDLTLIKGGFPPGGVIGHEAVGRVLSAPAETGFREGQLMAVCPLDFCGVCEHCRAGRGQLCADAVPNGLGFWRQGGLAERIAVPASMCAPMTGVDPLDATFVDPLAVTIHAVARSGRTAGPAAVIGLGSVGISMLTACLSEGLTPVAGVDPIPEKRDLALSVGAVAAAAPGDQAGLSASLGGPPEVVFECSGRPETIPEAANLVVKGGAVVLVGIYDLLSMTPLPLIVNEIDLRPSFCYDRSEWERSVQLISTGAVKLSPMAETAPLEKLPTLIEEMKQGRAKKIIAIP
ncbi:MAG TPA: alcohol dehydrogenase catalytic domain-containing protein [Actinomycetota bacterium]|jgi:2-desacetyl-2-hydroxyethyl bacteriochlorophyllide A dehydrogenase|nr:alcohol dehydrogenase catalytic domain-containing protein [Actinomycetota bacterium]